MSATQETEKFSRIVLKDPREAHVRPPFSKQKLMNDPGSTARMNPKPDHGEETYRGSGKLKGLNALVTGADSGIGRAIAISYVREGANVAISYLSEDSIEDFTTEAFDRIFKTNVYAPFWLSQAAMKHLPPGGSIINTVSSQGFDPSAYLLPYAATKSALIGMTKALAKLAIEQGIRVNAVAPGPVWTPFIPSTMSQDKVEKFGAHTLFERPAQPAELAPLYVWLASPEASFVTGEVYGCTGGQTPL